MKRVFRDLLFVLTALHLCGGHLGMMQIVAWAQMLGDYTEAKGLVAGVKETFDGEHPCAMCRKIAETKQDERKQNPLPVDQTEKFSKWLSLHPTTELPALRWVDTGVRGSLTPLDEFVTGHDRTAPPTPPPRLAA